MRTKLTIAALFLLGTTGAYALVAHLFPNTVDFPRIPTGPGTIGNILTKFFGPNLDGTGDAPNTLALSGVDASGYVKRQDCSLGEVWLGIDASGMPQCGTKGAMLAFAQLTDTGAVGPIVIKHPDNSTEDGYIGMMLAVGDMVSTPAGGSATIGFTTDDSIVRLDGDTSIEIQAGTLDGRTVAQVNLDQGLLWGRVLTSTGINFGGGGYIAGVRGTSIAMSNNTTDIGIIIPHSTRNTDAVVVTNSGAPIGMNVFTGGVGTRLEHLYIAHPYISSGGPTPSSRSDLYDTSMMPPLLANWITLNTRKDIVYMDLLYEDPTSTPATKTFATGELLVTLPTAGSLECTNLLTGSIVKVDETSMSSEEVTATPIESSIKTEVCATPTSKNIRCGSQGLVWWPTMNRCAPLAGAYADLTQSSTLFLKNGKSLEARYEMVSNDESKFNSSKILRDNGQFGSKLNDPSRHTDWRAGSLLAASMWSTLDSGLSAGIDNGQIFAKPWVQGVYVKTLYPISWEGSIGTNIWQYDQVYYLSGVLNHTPGVGVTIASPGQHLTYPINSLGNIAGFTGGTLAGKTVRIELQSPVGSMSGTAPSGTKFYVADFGTEKYFVIKQRTCAGITSSSNHLCKAGSASNIAEVTTTNIITLPTVSTIPIQMVIGNTPSGTPTFNMPIGTTIKKLSISSN